MSFICVERGVGKISLERTADKFKFHLSPMIKKTGEVAAAPPSGSGYGVVALI
jgi:hypothetical protein